VSPRTDPTVLTSRDTLAHLLHANADRLDWPVRLALSSAFNYLDDSLPTLAAPPQSPLEQPQPEYADDGDPAALAARIEALRADLLRLLEHLPDAVAADVDPYAVGHAAAELGTALRELSTGRPA
jgi:hypothetical protein